MNKIDDSASRLILPKDFDKPLRSPEGLGVWAKWGVELRDGDRLLDKREGPSHSFTKQFGKFIRGMFNHVDDVNETLTERGGASYLCRIKNSAGITPSANSPIMSAASRIRFGASSAALDSNQFDLQGAILSSTFGAGTVTLIVEDGVNTQFKVEATVVNTTGSPFTVEEMGLYAQVRSEGNVQEDTMFLRDLTGSIVVANTLTILGRWTFTIAV